jgi:hypothetical protein
MARGILALEVGLLLTLWGPQPAAWLWVGGQIKGTTNSVEVAITATFAGLLLTLFVTLSLVHRLDHAWRLVRRAAGHAQVEGIIERVFVSSAALAIVGFGFWFFVIAGPGPMLAPWR